MEILNKIDKLVEVGVGIWKIEGTEYYFLTLRDKIEVHRKIHIKDSPVYSHMTSKGLPERTLCFDPVSPEDFITDLQDLEFNELAELLIYHLDKF